MPSGYIQGNGTHKEQLLASKKWRTLKQYKPKVHTGPFFTKAQLPNNVVNCLPDYFPDWQDRCPSASLRDPSKNQEYRQDLAKWFLKWAPNCKCPYDPKLSDMSLGLMQLYHGYFLAFFGAKGSTRESNRLPLSLFCAKDRALLLEEYPDIGLGKRLEDGDGNIHKIKGLLDSLGPTVAHSLA